MAETVASSVLAGLVRQAAASGHLLRAPHPALHAASAASTHATGHKAETGETGHQRGLIGNHTRSAGSDSVTLFCNASPLGDGPHLY
ncbi:hypothetical protein [Megalodesulfovibrio paquesii]